MSSRCNTAFTNSFTACSKTQAGATLLAFILVMVIGSSYLLVRAFNVNSPRLEAYKQASFKLKLAKQALIGYAVAFPERDDDPTDEEGPGHLLCPDYTGDGIAAGNCGDGVVGRFPWKTLELPDVYDASGQTLWYAISANYRYGPNKRVPLNSETPGTLSVDGVDDIVAVIIAPGIPVTGQDRSLDTNEESYYLEDDNNDNDTAFVSTLPNPNTKRLDGVYDANDDLVLNDRLITISRQELMQAVEKRVLGEVGQILGTYFNTHNAYPWLTPFADPKALNRQIEGSVDAGSNASLLIDASQDFLELNVRANDLVYNVTDGSFGLVSGDPTQADRLNVAALYQGNENDFDEDDTYVVIVKNRADEGDDTIYGTASTNNALILEDTAKSFGELSIAPGDIVDNLTDNSSGIIESISGDEITVASLNGGTDNDFDAGDEYIIRTNYGLATGGSSAFLLEDTNKDFITMGAMAGDLVWNMTDDAMGRVVSVTNTTLTVSELLFGNSNTFSNGDDYMLVRHEAIPNTREGLLSFHEVGIPFQTGFQLDWNIAPSVADYNLTNANNLQQNYMNNWLANGSRTFDDSIGTCVWSVREMADCYAYYRDYLSIDGRMTSYFNTDRIRDSSAVLVTDNVKRGDIAQNYDDEISVMSGNTDAGTSGTRLFDTGNNFSALIPYSSLIHNTSQGTRGLIAEIVNANTLIVEPYVGSATAPITFSSGDNYTIYRPRNAVVDYIISENELDTDQYTSYNPDFDTNEYYRIIPASNSYSGTVEDVDSTGSTDRMEDDSGVDFIALGVEVGDVIRNDDDGSWGEITAVTTDEITTRLYSGSSNDFASNDNYTIYYDYVYSREHIIRPRFRGNRNTTTVSEVRNRDVCLGYNSDCTSTSSTNFTGNGTTPLLTVIDYQEDGTTDVGTSTFTPTGSSSGSLKVGNMKYSLAVSSGDIPAWFIKNDWHKLVYIAYSNDDAPGSASVCTAGTNCLTLDGASPPGNDNRALLISAGWETQTLRDANCNVLGSSVNQDRTSGNMNSYFELDNCDVSDDMFSQSPFTNDFNDQVRVLSTSP